MESKAYARIPLHRKIEAGYRMTHRNENSEKVTDIVNDLSILCSHLYSLETKSVSDPTMIDEHRAGCPPKVDERLERRIIREIKFALI